VEVREVGLRPGSDEVSAGFGDVGRTPQVVIPLRLGNEVEVTTVQHAGDRPPNRDLILAELGNLLERELARYKIVRNTVRGQ
jgi:hypothetical protein